jgi:FRG domain
MRDCWDSRDDRRICRKVTNQIRIREVTCTRWDQLIGELFTDSLDTELDRYRSPYVFRGLSDRDYRLESTLNRLGHTDTQKIRMIEERLVESFRKYAHGEFDPAASNWHWISLAQHHGLPTRLLDWTFSPFVALHFATSDLSLMDRDAVVWCVDRWAIQRWLPEDLRHALNVRHIGVFPIELLANEFPTFDKFDDPDQESDFMVFFEPPALDGRIINQGALFSFLSRPELDLDEWLARISIENENSRPPLCKKVIIANELKWEVRDKLDHANLQERVLFPGLDGLSAWLKRWYTPKHNTAGLARTTVARVEKTRPERRQLRRLDSR